MSEMKRGYSPEARRVVGVDVGTSSARAGVFDLDGRLLGHGAGDIETRAPRPDFFEQSSDGIWQACGEAIRAALDAGDVDPASVVGLSFDGTSSVAVLDADDRPVSVSPDGDDRWNILLWMDHRAAGQAERINRTKHEVLRYVGGKISPEMVCPKLLWLKENLPASWRRARRCIDLTDFLAYRATGVDVRSLCTTVCKWTYLGHEKDGAGSWAMDFFEQIGLADLFDRNRQGERIEPMGSRIGGLTETSAAQLGLRPGTIVGVGVIDAHAGALGLLGAALRGDAPPEEELERALALIGGTSSCHLAVSREARFLDGIWGPYFSALLPGFWLAEGGQTTSGSLIDHVIRDRELGGSLIEEARGAGETVYELLNRTVLELDSHEDPSGAADPELTRELHILPYYLGNRSPRADPSLRGVVSGVRLDRSRESVARQYLAAIQAVAYGTRHIIERMNRGGYAIDTVLVCGGGIKNPIWLQEHADITGCHLNLPREPEAVLLGSAILGAVASGQFDSIIDGMRAMGGSERVIKPRAEVRDYHDRKYRVFHRMYDHFLELRSIMDERPPPSK